MIDANNNINTIIWNNALRLLENDMTKPTFDTWFKSTELAAYYGENIIIKVQNDFAKNNLENNYFNIIKSHLESMLNHSVKIRFVTPQEKDHAIEELFQQQAIPKKTVSSRKKASTLFRSAGQTIGHAYHTIRRNRVKQQIYL